MPVWGAEARSSDRHSRAPVRFGVLFSGSGFHRGQWWAEGSGREMKLGRVLESLPYLQTEKIDDDVDVRGLIDAVHSRLKTPLPQSEDAA